MGQYEFDDEKYGCAKIGLFIILFLLTVMFLISRDKSFIESPIFLLVTSLFITYFIWLLINLLLTVILK